jgi:RNA polymerase sigma factor (sigma-70 family)
MSEAAIPRRSRAVGPVGRMLSDGNLARRAVAGDQRAFTAIYRRYHQSLYRFCLAIVGNPHDAQDALQNTMVKVLRALPGEKRQVELKPWLYRIAHNESIELLRRRRGTERIDPGLPARGPGPAEEAAQRERLQRLIADLGELPERQRGTLVMRELGDLDFEQIGAALGTSAAVARQTLYEARQSLRQMDAGREMTCAEVTRSLSDGDGRIARRRDIRAHLRTCGGCRQFRDEIDGRQRDLAAISPLPAVAAATLLHGLLGGQGGSGGLAGALGVGAAKTAGASVALKSAATVAVVVAVGVSAADYGGAIHVGLPGDAVSKPTRSPLPAATPAAAPAAAGRVSRHRDRVGAAPADAGAALRRSQVTTAGAKTAGPATVAADKAKAAPAARSTSHGASASHPHGRGHEKQHPAAAAHGQETAATHKAAGHGGGGGPSESSLSHPAKTAQPSHSAGSGDRAPHASPTPPTSEPESGSLEPDAQPPSEAESPHGPGHKP